jgi:Abnormal spindle-like microcephaly-assoc'd, ASPM-SPD-2-Hydin
VREVRRVGGTPLTLGSDGSYAFRYRSRWEEAHVRRMIVLLGVVLLLLGAPQAAAAASTVKINLDRNFGTQVVGTTTTHTVTITNTGTTAVRFGTIGVTSGDGAFGFAFDSNTCFSPDALLDPGESCSFDITFTPLTTGTLTGTTDISVDNQSTILKLRGRGV